MCNNFGRFRFRFHTACDPTQSVVDDDQFVQSNEVSENLVLELKDGITGSSLGSKRRVTLSYVLGTSQIYELLRSTNLDVDSVKVCLISSFVTGFTVCTILGDGAWSDFHRGLQIILVIDLDLGVLFRKWANKKFVGLLIKNGRVVFFNTKICPKFSVALSREVNDEILFELGVVN